MDTQQTHHSQDPPSYLNGFATTERPQRSTSDYVRSQPSRRPHSPSVSPLALSIAIHYLTRSDEDYAADDQRHFRSSPVQEIIGLFLDAGLLTEKVKGQAHETARYERTEGLEVWM